MLQHTNTIFLCLVSTGCKMRRSSMDSKFVCKICRFISHAIKSKIRFRHQWKFLILFVLINIIIMFFYGWHFTTVEDHFFQHHYKTFLEDHPDFGVSKTTCTLPKLDPWAADAKRYFSYMPRINCYKVQPYLTEVTQDGILQWNQTETNNLKSVLPQLLCAYQEMIKTPRNDKSLTLKPLKAFNGSAQLSTPFANVSCFYKNGLYYHNIHAWLPKNLLKVTNSALPNVQIFMIDAVSQSNFLRQLPKTYKFLTEVMSSFVFKGHVKIGLNTFPNIGAMLTGHNVYTNALPSHSSGFDTWPFAWKNFSQNGYVTLFVEDSLLHNTFSYVGIGFQENPTDIYMRPFWMAIGDPQGFLYGKSSPYCYGNVPQHQLYLDFLKIFMKTLKNKSPYFMFSITNLGHDELNMLQVIDEDLLHYFQWVNDNFKNNILIVMGDHGNNFGPFRATDLGRLECNFPYFSMSLPPKLIEKYPNLVKNLNINRNRMTSWYDVYDTLMDISTLRFDKPRKRWSKNGFSLFHQIPTDRSCQDAGIPIQYCPCQLEVPLAVDSMDDIVPAGKELVKSVNELLSIEPRCPPLEYFVLRSAVKILPSSATAKAKGFKNIYRVVVEVKPSHALLEGTMANDAWVDQFKPVAPIIRLDRFGNTTQCVSDITLRNFCYCN